jgi:dihydrofolate reductase
MAPSKKFAVVVAVTREFGIGNKGNLPWAPKRLNLDLAFLKLVTTCKYTLVEDGVEFEELSDCKNIVIMGRKTWDSIPSRFKPMDGRINIIITGDIGLFQYKSLNAHWTNI